MKPPSLASGSIGRYTFGGINAVVALVVTKIVITAFGPTSAYFPLLVAIGLSAWFAGVGPALLTQVCGAAVTFLFLVPSHPLAPVRATDVYSLLAFLVVGK